MFCFKSNHATWSLSFYLSGSFLGFQTCLNFLTDVKKGLEEETIEIHLHSGLSRKPPGKEYAQRIQMIWPNNKIWVTSSVYHLHTDSILVMFKSIHTYTCDLFTKTAKAPIPRQPQFGITWQKNKKYWYGRETPSYLCRGMLSMAEGPTCHWRSHIAQYCLRTSGQHWRLVTVLSACAQWKAVDLRSR